MNQTELFNCLNESDQQLVLIYFFAGACFLLLSYLLYYCKFLHWLINIVTPILMVSVGVMLFSIGGRMLNGHDYGMNFIVKALVIICTATACWVVYGALMWNKELRKKKNNNK